MSPPSVEARAYRSDLTPEGLPGRVGLDGDVVVFEGNGLRFDLPSASLGARIGGLDERYLFLQAAELPGLEIVIDRQGVEASQPLLRLGPVARAVEAAGSRRRRFWGCMLALAAVLVTFAVMILILFSLIARAAMGATTPSPPMPETAAPAAAPLDEPAARGQGRYGIDDDVDP